MRELDACGIGFVADAQGRPPAPSSPPPSHGLACVKHRGAVAADARTADGCGVCSRPSPRPSSARATGWPCCSCGATTPGPRSRTRCAAEGLEVVDWREPADSTTPPSATWPARPRPADRPGGLRSADGRPPHRATSGAGLPAPPPHRRDRRPAPTSCRARSAPSSTRAWPPPTPWPTSTSTSPTSASTAPFAIFHQRFSTNTLPTWERAQPFRTLCHNGEINAIAGQRATACAAAAALGTEEAGLGPEDAVPPRARPRRLRLRQARRGRRAAHAGRARHPPRRGHARARGVGGRARPRPRGARLLPLPLRAHGAVGRPGRRGVHRRHRRRRRASTATACARCATHVCDDGLVVCCVGGRAPSTSAATARSSGAASAPARCCSSTPTRGCPATTTRVQGAPRPQRGPTPRWAADGFSELRPGRAASSRPPDDLVAPPGHPRLHPGGAGDGAQAHGRPTPRSRPSRWATTRRCPPWPAGPGRCPLPEAALRPGHQPAHRPAARAAGDVPAHAARAPPPAAHRGARRRRACSRCRRSSSTRRRVDDLARHDQTPCPAVAARRHVPGRRRARGPRGRRSTAWPTRPRPSPSTAARASLVIDDARRRRRPGPDPVAARAAARCTTRLVAAGCGRRRALVVVADDARDVHGFAALLGYGADAICPRLALETVAAEADARRRRRRHQPRGAGRFQAAVEAGVLKILSKMGISTVDSYRGAQIFEVVGLGAEVVDVCFTGHAVDVGRRRRLGRTLGEDVLGPATPHARRRPRPTSSPPASSGSARAASTTATDKDVVQALNDLTLVQEPDATDGPGPRHGRPPTCCSAPSRGESLRPATSRSPTLVNDRPPTELHDLLELVAGRRAGARSTRSSRPPRSPGASRPAPCRTARCRRRRTRRWPRP